MTTLKPTDKHPDIRGSDLSATEPYHVPGYAGHKRQFVFRCGETFGMATNKLLTSDSQRRADGAGILKSIDPPRSRSVDLGFHEVPKLERDNYDMKAILSSRRQKWGDHVYKPNMRSGYMGFVPKAHLSSYHSKTFPNLCNEALKDFSQDQAEYKGKQQNLRDIVQLQCAPELLSPQREALATSQSLPLRQVRQDTSSFFHRADKTTHESPYFLPNEHPEKYFISGYAGHVPFAKDLSGHSFPVVTNKSLQRFTKEANRYHSNKTQPLKGEDLRGENTLAPPLPPTQVYLLNSGIIPRYSGYVPGQKFRFGKTFSNQTVNVLKIGKSKAPTIRASS